MSKKLKILFINRLFGTKFGGGENADINFAKGLKKLGHEVTFLTGIRDLNINEKMLKDSNIKSISLKVPYIRKWAYLLEQSRFGKLISPFFIEVDLLIFELRVIIYLINNNDFNCVQLCGLPRLASYLKNNKNKVLVRWPGRPGKSKFGLLSKYDYNICNGNVYEFLSRKGVNNLKYVNIGVNTQLYYPYGIDKNNIVKFLFVGRLIKIKNIPLLIDSFLSAIKINKNITLTIVGSGDKNLEKFVVNSISKNIDYLGELNNDKLPSIYNQHDVFIITSDYDNFPNTVLEAMSCGLPVIGTNVGGISSQITHKKTGLLVNKNDKLDLVNSILKIAKSDDLRNFMSKNARNEILNRYSWDSSSLLLEKIYKDGC